LAFGVIYLAAADSCLHLNLDEGTGQVSPLTDPVIERLYTFLDRVALILTARKTVDRCADLLRLEAHRMHNSPRYTYLLLRDATIHFREVAHHFETDLEEELLCALRAAELRAEALIELMTQQCAEHRAERSSHGKSKHRTYRLPEPMHAVASAQPVSVRRVGCRATVFAFIILCSCQRQMQSMEPGEPLFESNLTGLRLAARGKVRDIYELDSQRLLIVATDRISAFDVVLPNPIPGKGVVLTGISQFWFARLQHVIPNHLTGIDPTSVVAEADVPVVDRRSVVVQKLKPLPVEAVVRGYLIGSGWKDYCATGKVSGVALPAGMELAEELPEPIFTPSTKARPGAHDENISVAEVESLIGPELTTRIADVSLRLYAEARSYAAERGIIIADTKFEFGINDDGELRLIDEVFTPDSSRFWPADEYRRGASPPSFDKQYVRDYLESMEWDKRPPAPELPAVVIKRTEEKYKEAYRRMVS
jgi:phosphoribosylaminoimidazole-succinocarboxamide synthase